MMGGERLDISVRNVPDPPPLHNLNGSVGLPLGSFNHRIMVGLGDFVKRYFSNLAGRREGFSEDSSIPV